MVQWNWVQLFHRRFPLLHQAINLPWNKEEEKNTGKKKYILLEWSAINTTLKNISSSEDKEGKLSLDSKVWLSLLQFIFSWKWTNSTTLDLLPNIDIFNLFILKLFLKLSNLPKLSHHYDLSLTFMFHTKVKNTFFCWQTRASKKWEMKPKTYLSNFFSFFLIFLQNTQGGSSSHKTSADKTNAGCTIQSSHQYSVHQL